MGNATGRRGDTMRITYIPKRFRADRQRLIDLANSIIAEYEAQGFDLTLRQLYYQLVARDVIPNTEASYKRLGDTIADARLAGLVEWEAIEDRTRNLRDLTHWRDPRAIINAAVRSYRIDKWAGQPYRPEVWVEKDAVLNIVAQVCESLDVPYFSCRGYTSLSEKWRAGQRMQAWCADGQIPVVIHLGDHDPSGLDMTRDIRERLELFAGHPVDIRRIALNRDQIARYNPPPNPAKVTDSRAKGYIAQHGRVSWELDALTPTVLAGLIRDAIADLLDADAWRAWQAQEDAQREQLRRAAARIDTD